jgi:hypothetical protein
MKGNSALPGATVLVIFSGLPEVGMIALAQRLALRLRATYLRIDTLEQTIRDLCGIKVEGEGSHHLSVSDTLWGCNDSDLKRIMGSVRRLADEVERGLSELHSRLRKTVVSKLAVGAMIEGQTPSTVELANLLPLDTERQDLREPWLGVC